MLFFHKKIGTKQLICLKSMVIKLKNSISHETLSYSIFGTFVSQKNITMTKLSNIQ